MFPKKIEGEWKKKKITKAKPGLHWSIDLNPKPTQAKPKQTHRKNHYLLSSSSSSSSLYNKQKP